MACRLAIEYKYSLGFNSSLTIGVGAESLLTLIVVFDPMAETEAPANKAKTKRICTYTHFTTPAERG